MAQLDRVHLRDIENDTEYIIIEKSILGEIVLHFTGYEFIKYAEVVCKVFGKCDRNELIDQILNDKQYTFIIYAL